MERRLKVGIHDNGDGYYEFMSPTIMTSSSAPSPAKRLFFIALLPPVEIQEAVKAIQQDITARFGSRAAQKSPPHITVQPPFYWNTESLSALEDCLQGFARGRSSVPIQLSGFGAFAPRVIYVNVVKTPELMQLKQDFDRQVVADLGEKLVVDQRPYVPHMTVAFRDLTRQNFRAAWPEFQAKPFEFSFMADQQTLLVHNGQRWTVHTDFPFSDVIC
jgi:2'-5' RNA ligase